jgi:hypothetical protein
MKDNLFDFFTRIAEKGEPVFIDLKKKTAWVKGAKIISDGKNETSLPLLEDEPPDFFSRTEELYNEYEHSYFDRSYKPSKYFKKPEQKLDTWQGQLIPRSVAKIRLEAWILLNALSGKTQLPEGQWYWQSPNDRDLVLLKNWL